MPKTLKSFLSSLYFQIIVFSIISGIFGWSIYYILDAVGDSYIVNSDIYKNKSPELIAETYESVNSFLTEYEGSTTEALLDTWSLNNRYYILYVTDDYGNVLYSNDSFYGAEDVYLSIDNSRSYKIAYDGIPENLSITYLAYAELSVRNQFIAATVGIASGLALFLWLFKGIIDRIKSISTKLEYISGGDATINTFDARPDEIGALSENIDMMKNSLIQQSIMIQTMQSKDSLKIAALSHDIKTPLTVIFGYLEILKERDLTEDTANYLSRIEEKALEIQKLSSTLFSSVTDSPLSQHIINNEQHVLDTDVTAIVQSMRNDLELSGFIVVIEATPIPFRTTFPIEILEQVATSILSNLILYADTQEPVLIATSIQQNKLVIEVQNLAKVSQSETREYATHMGLSLNKKILEEYLATLDYFSVDCNYVTRISLPVSL